MDDVAVYSQGHRLPGDPDPVLAVARTDDAVADAGGLLEDPSAFVWLTLLDPSRHEVVSLAEDLALPALAVEDVVEAHQRPKLETYGPTVFCVVKPVSYDEVAEQVRVGEIGVFLTDDLVVLVQQRDTDVLDGLRDELDAREELLCRGPSTVLHEVLDRTVDEYERVVAALREDVDEVEDAVFSEQRTDMTRRTYGLKRQALELKRAVHPLVAVLDRLSAGLVRHVPEEMRPLFRDVHDHALRASDAVTGLDALLDAVLDANLAKVGQQENADQRRISAWAAIAIVPTTVAGVFGMNFVDMPLLEASYGFWLATAVTLAVCAGLYVNFKRNGWL